MANRIIKVPNADHPICVVPNPKRVVVTLGERVIADTRQAVTLREASYPPVHYIPRVDVDMTMLERTETRTYCPYKGDASYFSIPVGGERSVDAVGSYEEPYDIFAAIKDHVAFYPDRIGSIEEHAMCCAGRDHPPGAWRVRQR